MKASREYFSDARPFDATDDGCLLDGLEQSLAVIRESKLFGAGFLITAHARGVEVQRPDGVAFRGFTLRDALVEMMTTEW